jgi:activator of HSP90 ATPase
MESIRLTTTLSATPEDIYDAWISSKRHAAMTGGAASSEKRKGGRYTAWDGYISGKHLELEPGKRILQTWRTTEFPDTAPDSRLEVKLAAGPRGTKLTLLQSGIPDGQGEMYAEGWQEHYFEPMSQYFVATAPPAQTKKKKKKKKTARAAPPVKSTKPSRPSKAGRGKKKGAKKKIRSR